MTQNGVVAAGGRLTDWISLGVLASLVPWASRETEPSLAHTGFADQHDLRRGIGDARRAGLAQEAIGVKVPKVDDSVVVHPFVRPGRSQQGPAPDGTQDVATKRPCRAQRSRLPGVQAPQSHSRTEPSRPSEASSRPSARNETPSAGPA